MCHSIFEFALMTRRLTIAFGSNLLPQAAEAVRLTIEIWAKL
jgi:hypothetical protein